MIIEIKFIVLHEIGHTIDGLDPYWKKLESVFPNFPVSSLVDEELKAQLWAIYKSKDLTKVKT